MSKLVKIELYVPNALTMCNLFCGFLGLLSCYYGDLILASWLIVIGALFDVADGLAAKLLKAHSELGIQLDSLTDVVTFGVLPATIIHILFIHTGTPWLYDFVIGSVPIYPLLPFVIVMAAVFRLGKYNVMATNKLSDNSFVGLPTPAMALCVACIPLMLNYEPLLIYISPIDIRYYVLNIWILITFSLLISFLMVSKIICLSFKKFGIAQIAFSTFSLICFLLISYLAMPIILLAYLIFSYIFRDKTKEVYINPHQAI
ncbi:MAG: CDP-alcohol phosphatidyltransferase family protein [Bacteroidota bacterium]|nr:CDP-alcohol phosphatidyltransferase family protein [Bacteroidota bacterium]